ncbi:MAG TPA: hypothetical protein PLN30_07890, partial [Ferruginibacter sp.]|nr:hypothetical protein [Ferruginibacter sp.]
SGIRYIGDYEFFLKCAQQAPLVIIAAFLGWDRQHEVQERNFDPVKYEALRLDVLGKAISQSHQLSADEKKQFLKNQKNFLAKNLFRNFVKLRWSNLFSQLSLIKQLKKYS